MSNSVKVGTRVRVMDTDQKDLGLGTYQGDVAFDRDGKEITAPDDSSLLNSHPKIELDTGKVIYGYECWWTPTDEAFEAVLMRIEKAGKTIN